MTEARLPRAPGLLPAMVMLLAACTGSFPWSVHIPADLRTPSSAGVVEESTQLPNGHWEYRLSDGQILEIDYDRTTSLLGGPSVGRLLLAGEDPDGRRWVAGVSRSTVVSSPPGCFDWPDLGRGSDGWIEMSSGFRFRKAPNFTDWRDRKSDEYMEERGGFCLNDRGEVTSYEP